MNTCPNCDREFKRLKTHLNFCKAAPKITKPKTENDELKLLKQQVQKLTHEVEELKKPCYNCGQTGHVALDCPRHVEKKVYCYYCSGPHHANDCPICPPTTPFEDHPMSPCW